MFIVSGMVDAGMGERQINNVLAAVNLPGIHHKSLKKWEREVAESI
jgi:hypothetical protein